MNTLISTPDQPEEPRRPLTWDEEAAAYRLKHHAALAAIPGVLRAPIRKATKTIKLGISK